MANNGTTVTVHIWGKIPGSAGVSPAPEQAILPAFPANGPVLVNSYLQRRQAACAFSLALANHYVKQNNAL